MASATLLRRPSIKRLRLGDLLVSLGTITDEQRNAALAHQRQWGVTLGRALIVRRICTSRQILDALSQQTGLPSIDLSLVKLDEKLAILLPKVVAEKNRAVPLRVEGAQGEVLLIAMAPVPSLAGLSAVKAATTRRVVAYVALDEEVERAFGCIYLGHVATAVAQAPPSSELEFEFESEEAAEPAARPVLVYGWARRTSDKLLTVLATNRVTAKEASAAEVKASVSTDVVVAPMKAIDALFPGAESLSARLLAIKEPYEALEPSAWKQGAVVVLSTPLNIKALLSALTKLRGEVPVPPPP